MDVKSIIKGAIPLVIGILIGAGLTQNKYVGGILLGYVIFMFLFSMLKNRITKVKEAADKKVALKEQGWEVIQDVGEATLKGNLIGANKFDNFYKEYAFYFGIALVFGMFILLFFKLWLWSFVCFLAINYFVVLNQVQRNTREIKEHLSKEEKNGSN